MAAEIQKQANNGMQVSTAYTALASPPPLQSHDCAAAAAIDCIHEPALSPIAAKSPPPERLPA